MDALGGQIKALKKIVPESICNVCQAGEVCSESTGWLLVIHFQNHLVSEKEKLTAS